MSVNPPSPLGPTGDSQQIDEGKPQSSPKKRRFANLQVDTTMGSSSSLAGRASPKKISGSGRVIISTLETKPESERFLSTICEGLASGIYHFKDSSGNSAPVVIQEGNKTIAIFKRAETFLGQSRDGIYKGEGVYGELIGYKLGKKEGVPLTVLVELSVTEQEGVFSYEGKPIFGSLQEWVQNALPLEQVPTETLYADPVQSLAILDLRMLNGDRHGNNILFDAVNRRFIPIDHDCACPRLRDIDPYNFFWMYSPHSIRPFSQERLMEIQNVNPLQDRKEIEALFPNFPSERLDSMQLSATLLKKGAERGLSPFEIGCFFYNLMGSEHDPLATIIYKKVTDQKPTSLEMYAQYLNTEINHCLDAYKHANITPEELLSVVNKKAEGQNHIFNFCKELNKRVLPNLKA